MRPEAYRRVAFKAVLFPVLFGLTYVSTMACLLVLTLNGIETGTISSLLVRYFAPGYLCVAIPQFVRFVLAARDSECRAVAQPL